MIDCANIRGFNYHPSYGTSGLEIWQKFDAAQIRTELGRGRRYFPGMNAIRFWLAPEAWRRDRKAFEMNFEAALQIAASFGLVVMPVLCNRWHDSQLDYGGVYIDHFLPCGNRGSWNLTEYLDAIVGPHATDPRIFAWDLCNEPFYYASWNADPFLPILRAAEHRWLASLYQQCKTLGAQAPVTVGVLYETPLEEVDPISDFFSVHPYHIIGGNARLGTQAAFEKLLDEFVAAATRLGKPLLATETCWGSLDDATRVANLRYTLGELKKRRIGWLAYALHHSLIADLHRPEFGPVGVPGNLAFIDADGTLRPGHEAFNEF